MKSMLDATAYGREDKVAVIHFLEQNHRIIEWLGTSQKTQMHTWTYNNNTW